MILGRFCDVAKKIAKQLPQSLYALNKLLGYHDHFQKLVVCPKCNSVYKTENCVERAGVSKLCTHQEFSHAQRCNTLLLKTVELASGKKVLYPFKIFCYQSLQGELQRILLLPHFHDSCEQWRTRTVANRLEDVYDGQIWKEFMNPFGKRFLSTPYNYALALNIDWFKPYKHTESSVGVMYLTILNLPRSLRYKRENTLLIGIIPGPTEPKQFFSYAISQ